MEEKRKENNNNNNTKPITVDRCASRLQPLEGLEECVCVCVRLVSLLQAAVDGGPRPNN